MNEWLNLNLQNKFIFYKSLDTWKSCEWLNKTDQKHRIDGSSGLHTWLGIQCLFPTHIQEKTGQWLASPEEDVDAFKNHVFLYCFENTFFEIIK